MSTFLWNFGDGNISTLQNPQHVYTEPGVFEGSLTTDFGTYTSTKYFVANIYPGSGNLSFLWDFGDGVTSTLQTPNHIYDKPGVYEGSLTTDFVTYTSTKYFVANVYSSGDVLWEFGDGTFSTETNPAHIYANPGVYTATGGTFDGQEILFTQEIIVNALTIPTNTTSSTIKPVLTNLRIVPYNNTGDTIEVKVETFINNKPSYNKDMLVKLLMTNTGDWVEVASGYTNKFGVCYLDKTIDFSGITNSLGIATVSYNGVDVYSNPVRFNIK
jgi:PKD repeat protein